MNFSRGVTLTVHSRGQSPIEITSFYEFYSRGLKIAVFISTSPQGITLYENCSEISILQQSHSVQLIVP